MVSLKLSPVEAAEATALTAEPDKPNYGYGTCVQLNDEQVEALGIAKLPVGTKVKIVAFGVIDSTRIEVGEEGEAPYMSIQLTDMEVGGASSVNASAMYPSSNG